jgi:hypothetical protein
VTRFVNLLLLIAIVVGAVNLVRLRQQHAALDDEHRRLADRYGALDVKDPAKYLVTRIETGDPTHFLWRCYCPAGLRMEERCSLGSGMKSSGSSQFAEAGEHLYRCRIELGEEFLRVHTMDRGGGGLVGSGPASYVAFLKDHWDELDIESLAAEGTVELSTDEVLPFLTIRIPEHLRPELVRRTGKQFAQGTTIQTVVQMVYGTREAFQAFDARRSENSP